MNCQPNLIHAYADHELDAAATLQVEEHLRECETCARAYENVRAVRAACAPERLYFELPAGLERRIRSAARRQTRPAALRLAWRPMLAIAATVMVVAGVGATVMLRGGTATNALAEQIVAAHVRSLLVEGRSVDVRSSNHHQVKPWLAARLDFAPDVPELSAAGFELQGGRLDYLANRRVAALVYRYHEHLVDVFAWPSDRVQTAAPVFLQRQGYWLAYWTDAGLNHWAITDASEDSLRTFVAQWQTASSAGKTKQ